MSKSEVKIERRRLRSGYLTSAVSITLLLIMLGSVSVLYFNTERLSKYILENLSFKIILQDLKQERVEEIKWELSQRHYIREDEQTGQKEITLVDKDAAAIEFQKELGEDFIKHIGSNPLHDVYIVKFDARFANTDSIQMIEEDLMTIAGIKEVYYQKNLIEVVNKNISKIALIVLIFSSLLLLIALTLINNTVRLAIYSKRFIIRTMQLVGATAAYIRMPFLFRSIIQGIVGATVATGVIAGLVYYLQSKIQGTIPLNDTFTLLKVYAILLVVGILINGASTYIAVTKYLRIKTDKLYT
ncbi:MAG: hypothetical protein JW801_00310 [Bacteroidales bacterium]|nr:hypothetical protein [Bacteroidales bacterium]